MLKQVPSHKSIHLVTESISLVKWLHVDRLDWPFIDLSLLHLHLRHFKRTKWLNDGEIHNLSSLYEFLYVVFNSFCCQNDYSSDKLAPQSLNTSITASYIQLCGVFSVFRPSVDISLRTDGFIFLRELLTVWSNYFPELHYSSYSPQAFWFLGSLLSVHFTLNTYLIFNITVD